MSVVAVSLKKKIDPLHASGVDVRAAVDRLVHVDVAIADIDIEAARRVREGSFRVVDRSTLLAFVFQAEDGIRVATVTGVQTCALPISSRCRPARRKRTTFASTPRTPAGSRA